MPSRSICDGIYIQPKSRSWSGEAYPFFTVYNYLRSNNGEKRGTCQIDESCSRFKYSVQLVNSAVNYGCIIRENQKENEGGMGGEDYCSDWGDNFLSQVPFKKGARSL